VSQDSEAGARQVHARQTHFLGRPSGVQGALEIHLRGRPLIPAPNGNTTLTPEATAVYKRIHVLREVAKRSGFATINEQAKILLSLSDSDLLDVSAILSAERGTR
jgi:hypothetical protein